MGHYVYKYVYDDKIIYIGKNDTDLHSRINQHKLEDKFKPYLKSSKIYYCKLANSIMSDVVESELIKRYKPKLNVAKMSNWTGLEFKEPKWMEYTYKQKTKNKKEKYFIPTKTKEEIKKCRIMSIYCHKMLKSIINLKEYDLYYEIEIPYISYELATKYVTPPYIKFDTDKVCGFLSLGIVILKKKRKRLFIDLKRLIFKEIADVEVGLIPRLKYMEKMFVREKALLISHIKQLEYTERKRKCIQ